MVIVVSNEFRKSLYKKMPSLTRLSDSGSETFEAPVLTTMDDTKALIDACLYGDATRVEQLLRAGADVNLRSPNHRWRTLCMIACAEGHDKVVEMCLAAGADINAATNHFSFRENALLLACESGNARVVAQCLHAGAQVNAKNGSGYSPLMIACMRDHEDVVGMLLHARADVNASSQYDPLLRSRHRTSVMGMTSLMYACQNGNAATVKQLLHARADISATTDRGKTCLMFACEENHPQVVSVCLEAGAKVNTKCRGSNSPLMFACRTKKPNAQVVATLLDHGAKVNHRNNQSFTAIHWAYQTNYSTAMLILVLHGSVIPEGQYWLVVEEAEKHVKALRMLFLFHGQIPRIILEYVYSSRQRRQLSAWGGDVFLGDFCDADLFHDLFLLSLSELDLHWTAWTA